MEPGPRRIAVIGRAGAGKTTLAVRLAREHDLPLIHLDRLFWGPGWQPRPVAAFEADQAAAVAGDRWVIDGGYLSSDGFADRIRRADLVVLAEAPLPVCLWRVLRRSVLRRGQARPDLPEGCDEQLSAYFVWWTLTWSWRNRGLVGRVLQTDPGAHLQRVRTWPTRRPDLHA